MRKRLNSHIIANLLNYLFNYGQEEITKEFTKVYSPKKSPDPPGSFRYKRARKID